MKSHLEQRVAFTLLLLFFLIVTGCIENKEKLIESSRDELISENDSNALRLIYSDVEAFPIQMGNGHLPENPPGVVIEMLNQIGEELNLTIEYKRFPNKRVLYELQAGKADGAFSYSYNESRLEYGVYPLSDGLPDRNRRIVSISYYIYKHKDSPLAWDGSVINNNTGPIGANTGYSIVKDLIYMGVDVSEATSTEQNFERLSLGRIEGYAQQDITGDLYINSPPYEDIVKLPIPLATKDYFLIFSNRFMNENPALAERIWIRIGEIRDSFTIKSVGKYKPTS